MSSAEENQDQPALLLVEGNQAIVLDPGATVVRGAGGHQVVYSTSQSVSQQREYFAVAEEDQAAYVTVSGSYIQSTDGGSYVTASSGTAAAAGGAVYVDGDTVYVVQEEGEEEEEGTAEEFMEEGDETQEEGEASQEEGETAQEEGEAFQEEGEASQEEGEAFQEEGEASQEEGEASQEEGEALQEGGEASQEDRERPLEEGEAVTGKEEKDKAGATSMTEQPPAEPMEEGEEEAEVIAENKPLRAPPKSQKTPPRSIPSTSGASALVEPKPAISGYFRFLSDRRKEVGESEASGGKATDLAKKWAQAWKELTAEERRKYNEEANLDRQRYQEELKDFLAAGGKPKEAKAGVNKKKKMLKMKKKALFKSKNPNLKAPMISGPLVDDVPIFTPEFLEHNKRCEQDLRTLKKTCTEVEEQNALLLRQCSRLDSAIHDMGGQVAKYRKISEDLDAWLRSHRNELLIAFAVREIPGVKRPTMETIDEFVKNCLPRLKNKTSTLALSIRSALAGKRQFAGMVSRGGRGRGRPPMTYVKRE